jgi:uncharacterized protein (DUF433 family)
MTSYVIFLPDKYIPGLVNFSILRYNKLASTVAVLGTVHEKERKMALLQGVQEIFQGIVQDPEINSGRPIIKNTRVFVDLIIGHLEKGMKLEEICSEYNLTKAQVQAVKNLKPEQIQYIKGYADALENMARR